MGSRFVEQPESLRVRQDHGPSLLRRRDRTLSRVLKLHARCQRFTDRNSRVGVLRRVRTRLVGPLEVGAGLKSCGRRSPCGDSHLTEVHGLFRGKHPVDSGRTSPRRSRISARHLGGRRRQSRRRESFAVRDLVLPAIAWRMLPASVLRPTMNHADASCVGHGSGYLDFSTTRSLSFCTGRLLALRIVANRSMYFCGAPIGCFITIQRTCSVQGGVVNEPE